eukprot:3432242-Pleurochrysis_carterae.AAC.2
MPHEFEWPRRAAEPWTLCKLRPRLVRTTVKHPIRGRQTAMFITISLRVAARSNSHSAKRIVTGTRIPDMSVGNSVGRVRAIQCCG